MEFRILGPLQVFDAGREVAIRGMKEQAILAVLVLRANEVVSRASLIDELWGESPPSTAMKAVNVYISRLRRALSENGGDPIATRPRGYALEIDPELIDAARFRWLVAEAHGHLLACDYATARNAFNEALGLWRGRVLGGIELESCTRTDVALLEDARLSAYAERLDCDLALGLHAEIISELTALVAENPLHERLRAQLMLALYRSGRQTEALRAYREVREALNEQLGLEPTPALQRLERGILIHDPALEGQAAPAGPLAPVASHSRRLRTPSRRALTSVGVAVALAAAAATASVALRQTPTRPVAIRILPNSVLKIDPVSDRILSDTPVGDTPVPIVATRNSVWVINRRDRTVSTLDRRTGRLRTIGGATFAYDLAADSHGDIWVSDSHDRVVDRITAGVGEWPTGLAPPETIHVPGPAGALAVGGGYLWVANAAYTNTGTVTGRASVSQIDLRSHRLVSSIRVRGEPVALAFGYGSAWVVDSNDSLSMIRVASSKPQRIPLPLQADNRPLSVAVGAGSAWVTTEDGLILRIDPETRRIIAKIPARMNPMQPLGVAAGNRFVWVANRSDFSIAKIDAATNHVIRTIPVGGVGVVPCGVTASRRAIWVTVGPDTDCGSSATR